MTITREDIATAGDATRLTRMGLELLQERDELRQRVAELEDEVSHLHEVHD